MPQEHAKCGPGLESGSGFTYCPEEFMNNGSELRMTFFFVKNILWGRCFKALECVRYRINSFHLSTSISFTSISVNLPPSLVSYSLLLQLRVEGLRSAHLHQHPRHGQGHGLCPGRGQGGRPLPRWPGTHRSAHRLLSGLFPPAQCSRRNCHG